MAIPITNYPPFQYLIPPQAIDSIINNSSQRLLWGKAHQCPSVGDTGGPNPTYYSINRCPVCLGRGVYWEPVGTTIHYALFTLVTWLGRNVDIGAKMDQDYGLIERGHPIMTVPTTDTVLWENASVYDLIVQVDTSTRFQALLRVNENDTIPAWHSIGDLLNIEPTGAVIVQDPTTALPVSGVAYTVSGGQVLLTTNPQYPYGYPEGTSFTVTYTSPNVFVLFEEFGAYPHQRPFGQGLKYARRFKVSLLDLFLRDQLGSSLSITSTG